MPNLDMVLSGGTLEMLGVGRREKTYLTCIKKMEDGRKYMFMNFPVIVLLPYKMGREYTQFQMDWVRSRPSVCLAYVTIGVPTNN